VTMTLNGNNGQSISSQFVMTITAVGDPPVVSAATTSEDTQTTTGLVITRNAADGAEITQFKITNIQNGSLFKNDGVTRIFEGDFIPVADGNAGLKFTPTANLNSPSTSFGFTAQAATNSGATSLGAGTNVSITVNPVNDAPTFTKGADQKVNRDPNSHVVPGWATNISAGAANESSQALSFQLTGNTNTALFSVPPAIDSSGTLTYTSVPNATGTASITINLKDNGGASPGADTSAPQTFNITVTLPPVSAEVNSTGDAADLNIGDGVCDTDAAVGNQILPPRAFAHQHNVRAARPLTGC
jgi:hypothetical protein